MSQARQGFTLIELLIVITIVVIIAAIAVPNLLSARISSNESSAIGTLKAVNAAQTQSIQRSFIDIDGDGAGEYGFFMELSGAIPPRGLVGIELLPPLLSSGFRQVTAGQTSHSGYTFIIYLPDAGGVGLSESAANYPLIDANVAENFWCCYAWPLTTGQTGRRAFFINQRGEIMVSDNINQGYDGAGTIPAPDAAYPPTAAGRIDQNVTPGQPASDGGTWVVLD